MPQRARRHTPRAAAVLEPVESRLLMAAQPLDLEGVQNAALDIPRAWALLQRSLDTDPLIASDPFFGDTFNVEVFYDTGASGVLLSKETADALGVNRATHNGEPILFEDVGVAGSSFFEVSEPLHVSLAPYGVERDLDNIATYQEVYDQKFGPVRLQVAMEGVDPVIGTPLDVFGMPTMAGKVVVMDARPLNSEDPFELGVMKTYPYNPGTPYNAADDDNNPGIPPTNLHVDLSYAHFDRFTDVSPAGAPGPSLRYNPFIGPNPVLAIDPSLPPDNTPGITVGHGGKSFTGSWLLDTGAMASMLSVSGAEAVGVHYAEGTYGTDEALLVDENGNEVPNQFTLQIGGIGGSINAAGFFLDSMVLPTVEGQPIRYLGAPVLVLDISVADPDTGESVTLDGIFGMNFLVASMLVDGSEWGGAAAAGPYDWVVFDEPNGVLGLGTSLPGVPEDPSVVARHVFYGNGAIAREKQALLPGQSASFANYTSSHAGITGVMVDVMGLPNAAGLGPEDFIVRTGTTADPSTWAAGPAPAVSVTPDFGATGSDRIKLTWAEGQIRNKWVQVTVRANADTGLASPDVFYFGNLAGDTGDHSAGATQAVVSGADQLSTRSHMGELPAPDSRYDHRRDGQINSIDVVTVRANLFQTLRLITAPTGTGAAAASADPAGALPAGRTTGMPPRRRAWYDVEADLLGRAT